MNFEAILLLSAGLAMDAAAVSAAKGLRVPRVRVQHVASVALFFGGFQALMPLAGWLLGKQVGPWFDGWQHLAAFCLLSGVGGKLLWEARSEPEADKRADNFGLRVMLLLGVATSIDAFAVGVTLPMLGAPLVLSLSTIGVTTALFSVLGLYAGRRFGAALGGRLDALGGLVLIALGGKILIDHLVK